MRLSRKYRPPQARIPATNGIAARAVSAIRNAELAERLYPGWTCRFYVFNLGTLGRNDTSATPMSDLFRGGIP